jgi:prepilin-type N-terminal cleavage/methylation domain-containing protein
LRYKRARGFTLIEIAAAIAVLSVVMVLVIQLLAFSRAAARANIETRLASSVAQGAYDRLRGMSADELRRSEKIGVALPPEASRLREAKLEATSREWEGGRGLRHVRIVLTWRSARNVEREIVREGLASDHRAR